MTEHQSSSDWEIDPAKFGKPATKGDVALLAVRLQRVCLAARMLGDTYPPENVAKARAGGVEQLKEIEASLEEMQRLLIGKDGA